MELWVGILLFLLALVCLGAAVFLGPRYLRRPKAPPQMAPTVAEKSGDVTMMEGVGLDDGTLVSGAFSVASPARTTARLRYTTRGVANDVLLDQPVTNIGRGSANQIDIGDLLASRRHARIVLEDGEYWIEDCQSHNHTFVNGVMITRQKLSRGDKIKIGETLLTFVRESG